MAELCAWAALLAAGSAAAQYGTGRDGALVVTSHTTINESAVLTANAAAGEFTLTVTGTGSFAPGASVLVVQMQWVTAGDRPDVGAFEVHRLTRVSGAQLELEDPLRRAFSGAVTQVVTLPEYTTVNVAPDAGLFAQPWTGRGGVLAFLASESLVNDGVLDARGAGFRGGTGRSSVDERGGCTRLDEPVPGGSERGEGAQLGGFGPAFTGRGENDTGGGGGVCAFSGGGGGAHRGEGGMGGFAADSTATGGQGGLALLGSGLVMGGGGGAANGLKGNPRNGGNGGGIIFIAARELSGRGVITSDGSPGGGVTEKQGAGSGGGAGGTVWLEVASTAICQLSALGGFGGSSLMTGPGGGGGGGLIRLQAQVVTYCTTVVSAGAPGLANGRPFGAGPIDTDSAPNLGTVSVTDVYTEPTPLPKDKVSALLGIGCGCSSSGELTVLAMLVFGLLRRRR